MVKALKNYKVALNSIYDILKIIDPDEELRPVNIFIEGWQTIVSCVIFGGRSTKLIPIHKRR